MQRPRIPRLSIQLFILDALLTSVGLSIAVWLRATLPIGRTGALPIEATRFPLIVYIVAILCYSTSLVLNGSYNPQRVLRWFNEAALVCWSMLVATVLMAGFLYMTFREISRLQFIYIFIVNLGLLLGYRAVLRVSYRLLGRARPEGRNRILILGAGELGSRLAGVLQNHSRWGYNLVGFLDDDPGKQVEVGTVYPVLGEIQQVQSIVKNRKIDEVWVALPVRAFDRLKVILSELETLPVRIKVIPDYLSMALVKAQAEVLDGIPIIGLREPIIDDFSRLVKRAFDISLVIISLLLSWPGMLLIALAIRLDTPGPIVFKQERTGENGQLFGMYKFRTMIQDAEARLAEIVQTTEEGELVHKRYDDPRITRVGMLLRRFSLDELPQMINVLKGEMSLVGPRPEQPWLVDRYDSWQRKRFSVPQGITGWWQINGRSDRPMHLHTDDDLYYIYNYSLWLDLLILLRTPLVVFSGKGAF